MSSSSVHLFSDDLFCIDSHNPQDRIVSSIVLLLGDMSGDTQGQELCQPLMEWEIVNDKIHC